MPPRSELTTTDLNNIHLQFLRLLKQNMVTCGHILPVSLKIIVFLSSIISITRLFERSTLYKLQTFTKTCAERQQNSWHFVCFCLNMQTQTFHWFWTSTVCVILIFFYEHLPPQFYLNSEGSVILLSLAFFIPPRAYSTCLILSTLIVYNKQNRLAEQFFFFFSVNAITFPALLSVTILLS